MCGKNGRSKGNKWWWNEEVKEEVSWKIGVHKIMCRKSTEENKRRYKNMKKANKEVSKTMREMADEAHTELKIVQIGCLD